MKEQTMTRVVRLALTAMTLLIHQAAGAQASPVYGYLEQFRCQQDPFTPGAIAEVQARLDWGFKCYPDLMETFGWLKNPVTKAMPQGTVYIYPVFGYRNADNSIDVLAAPKDKNAACDTLEKRPGQRVRLVGYCGLGCLTGDQIVLFGQSTELEIGSKQAKQQSHVMTLKEGSRLNSISLQETPLVQIVTDLEPKKQTILVISAGGNQIKVTENHPLVDGEGQIRRADQFQLGQFLVNDKGQPVEITQIEKTEIDGKVFNIKVDSPKIEENIYIAQGFLSGTIKLQNEYVRFLNRSLLRKGDLIDLDGI